MGVRTYGHGFVICVALAAAVVSLALNGCDAAYTAPNLIHVPDGGVTLRGDTLDEAVDGRAREGLGPRPQANDQDLIIVHDKRPIAFFGLFETRRLGDAGFDLFDRTLKWVNDGRDPEQTRVFLLTFNGTLQPEPPEEANGLAVYQRMIRQLGYRDENIQVARKEVLPQANFEGFDIVIYATTEPIDARNAFRQEKPYLTFSAGQTDELEIGNGEETIRDAREIVWVYNNQHPITAGLDIGPFTLGQRDVISTSHWARQGVVLMTADDVTIPCDSIKRFKVKCNRRDVIKMKVVMRGTSFSGAQICIKVDEDCYIWIPVVSKKAKDSKPSEEGLHPVVMGIPDCGLETQVTCP